MKTAEQPKNIVAYYRLSKQSKNGENYGLGSQSDIVHYYYGDRIVAEFKEVISGDRLDNRVQLQKAIEYCNANGYYLVVAKVDRLSRTTEDVLTVWNQLNKRLYCCDIPGELDKFRLTIYALIADREKELIRIRTRAGVEKAIQAGKKPGNPKLTPELSREASKRAGEVNRHKADTNQANVLASDYVCTLRKQGLTFKQIADRLNSKGYKSARGGKYYATTVKLLFERYCNK